MADVSKFVLGGSTGVELDIKDATARELIETIDTDLSNKADVATTLSGYGITDAYTQTEVDTLLADKADSATTLSGYGITDAYTQTEVDSLLSAKQGVLTFDDEPTEDSTNPVTSGGVYDVTNELSSEISNFVTTPLDNLVSSITNAGLTVVYKSGGLYQGILLNISINLTLGSSLSADTWYTVGRLGGDYAPAEMYYGNAFLDNGNPVLVRVNTSGQVALYFIDSSISTSVGIIVNICYFVGK